MTQERLYELANAGLTRIWCEAHDKLMKNPNNTILQERERKYWEELQELKVEWLGE